MCFLFPAVYRRCAHIYTNCARTHSHKQTSMCIGTSTHNCTNSPPFMHSYLHALTIALTHTCTYLHPHTLTFLHIHTRTHSHALILACTHTRKNSPSKVSYTLSHSFAHSHSCPHAHLRICKRTLGLTRIPIHTRTHYHSFMHTILHTRALACRHSFKEYLTLLFSFSYVFVGCFTLFWGTHSSFYLLICICETPSIIFPCLLDT